MTAPILLFESHATSEDNERGLASGHFDSPLSEKGVLQALELGARYKETPPDIILCSDLHRSYKTAELAFSQKAIPILRDRRLREWNYGNYNGSPVAEVDVLKPTFIHSSFSDGESLQDAVKRILLCVDEYLKKYPQKTLLLIGHRATYYALENRYNGISLERICQAPWKWQPGWRFKA